MPDAPHDLFARFFMESREALCRYVRRLVRSRETANEIVQEAFLRTYEQRDSVRTPRAFLFSTARNLAADQHRRERTAATDSVGDFETSEVVTGGALEDELIADEASRLLREAIDRLPPQCRAAFTLKVFHGCSYKEIGTRLGLSQKTIEKHIARAIVRTHAYLRTRYSERILTARMSADAVPASEGSGLLHSPSQVALNDAAVPDMATVDTKDDHG